MRIYLFLLASFTFASLSVSGQQEETGQYAKQHVRLYAQAGLMSSSIRHSNPSSGDRILFNSSGISHPGFGLGAIIESKAEKPRFFFGLGFWYTKMDYQGEHYVRIISPSQEELEKYDARHSTMAVDLFAGHYIHLGGPFSLKPQLGMSIHTYPKNEMEIAVYNYQNGDFKRDYSYKRSGETNMVGTASLFFSFRKSFELGATYFTPTNNALTRNNISRISTWGAVLRYVHSF